MGCSNSAPSSILHHSSSGKFAQQARLQSKGNQTHRYPGNLTLLFGPQDEKDSAKAGKLLAVDPHGKDTIKAQGHDRRHGHGHEGSVQVDLLKRKDTIDDMDSLVKKVTEGPAAADARPRALPRLTPLQSPVAEKDADQRDADNRAADQRAADQRSANQKTVKKSIDQRAAEHIAARVKKGVAWKLSLQRKDTTGDVDSLAKEVPEYVAQDMARMKKEDEWVGKRCEHYARNKHCLPLRVQNKLERGVV